MNIADHIYIIGAGAIGKVLAVLLSHNGKKVTLLRGSVNDIPDSVDNISVKLQDGTLVSAAIKVSTINNSGTLDGIIVLTNKSFGNLQLSESLKGRTGHSPIVLLQNGLHVEQPFSNDHFPQVYRCVIFATSQPGEEGALKFKPAAVSPIGIVKGGKETLAFIAGQLSSGYFPFAAEENIQPVIWTKAIANSVFNSVCPLLETDNGIFDRNEQALAIAKRVIAECISIAAANGVLLDMDAVVNRLLLISRSASGQLISTYQDILNKRRTEIDTLNLAIAGMAKDLGREEEVAETRLLGELVKLKSELAMNNG